MRTDDFDYDLPEELIAQEPADPRDSCRLLVLDRATGKVEHRIFRDIVDYLDPGDLLVANETRVMPARLRGRKRGTGGACEVLLLKRREDLDPMGSVWECLVNTGRRIRPGAHLEFGPGIATGADGAVPDANCAESDAEPCLLAEVEDFVPDSRGGRIVRFVPQGGRTLDAALHEAGHVPLPPYLTSYHGDPERYQTVYAMHDEHSAAAPTAGLHFTPELVARLEEKGVAWETLELEVGIDTFRLVEEDDPTQHVMHTERYHVPQRVVDAVHATKAAEHRVVAVGTTSVRSLESAWDPDAPTPEPPVSARRFPAEPGDIVERVDATTNLYLMPGSTYHVVDALITNFHVPRSTLMMLVSAFATREQVMAAYQEAIRERYRFFSFGDAMLIV